MRRALEVLPAFLDSCTNHMAGLGQPCHDASYFLQTTGGKHTYKDTNSNPFSL